MLSKMYIRQVEETLPAISESMAKMQQADRLSVNAIYENAKKIFLTLKKRSCILEIGCGDGLWLNHIYNDLSDGGNKYVGVDFSVNKLKLAKRKSKKLGIDKKVDFILADAEFLPFKKATFDVAIILEVLEHFLKPGVNINELSDTVIPSGKVLITTPSAYGANGNLSSILTLLFWPIRQNKSKFRKSSIIVQGLTLPHRDFTLEEIIQIVTPNFSLNRYYTFNFGFQYIFTKALPKRSAILLTGYIESKASWFPYTWGHSWMLLLEKKSNYTRGNTNA